MKILRSMSTPLVIVRCHENLTTVYLVSLTVNEEISERGLNQSVMGRSKA